MFILDIEFSWERPVTGRGFVWQDDNLTRIEGAAFETYEPLKQHPALFQDFAALERTQGTVLAFANRYGDFLQGAPGLPPSEFGSWQAEISQMQYAIAIWDALGKRDWKTLLADENVKFCLKVLSPGKHPKPAEIATAAVTHLVRYVDQHVFHFGSTPGAGRNSPKIIWSEETGHVLLRMPILSPMNALRYQFALAVLGNKSYQQCEACSRWMLLGPGVNRADRKACSDTCRGKLYRLRQRKANELYDTGVSLQRIAKELGSDVPTVRGWVSKRKESQK
jgi:hypothetical protein